MFRWLIEATVAQRRVFWACFAGWSLDAFDTQIFGLAIPALITSLGLSRSQAGLIPSITLVTAAFGGWLGGALSDRIGRVRALQLAVLWFAVGSLFAAFAKSYPTLLALKAVQGFGFGAEWAAGAVLIAETIQPEHRGKAMGAVQSGWAVGWGAAVLAFGALFSFLAVEIAWRTLFAIGVLPALLVLTIQFRLREPARSVTGPKQGFMATVLGIFRRDTLRSTVAGGLLGLGAHGGYYGLFTWLPTYLKTERELSVVATSSYLGVIIVAFGTGCLVSGQMLDRLGRRATVALYAIGCIVVAAVYLLAPINNAVMLVLGFPLGFCAAGIPAAMGTLFSEIFPENVRGSGVGFCYNFGRVMSAGFPALIGIMGEGMPLGVAIGVDAAVAYALVLIALQLLPRAAPAPLAISASPQLPSARAP